MRASLVPAAHPRSGLRIAIVQPADDAARPAAKLARLRRLTLLATRRRPDLIVWPESAVDGYAFDRALQGAVAGIAREAKAPILFGSADFGKFARSAGRAAEGAQFKNQAYLVFPDGAREGPYTKNRLVPFGEYMPFQGVVEWPRWLVRRQVHGIAGREPGLFRVPGGATLGVLICWENYFTGLTDRLVRNGAGIVVQLSNDADFGASAEPAQHNAASVLRAVEYRRPWLQVSGSGPSLLIDPSGAIFDSLGPIGAPGWIVRTVSPAATTTVYERFGLAWFWLVAAFAALLVAQRFIRREGSHVHIETN